MYLPPWLRARAQRYYRRLESFIGLDASLLHFEDNTRHVILLIRKFFKRLGKIEIDESCLLKDRSVADSNHFNSTMQKIKDSITDGFSLLEETKRKTSYNLNMVQLLEYINKKKNKHTGLQTYARTLPVKTRTGHPYIASIEHSITGPDSFAVDLNDIYYGLQFGCVNKEDDIRPRLDFTRVFPKTYYDIVDSISDDDPRSFFEFEVVILEEHKNDDDYEYVYTQTKKTVNNINVDLILTLRLEHPKDINSIDIDCTGNIIKIQAVEFSGKITDIKFYKRSNNNIVFPTIRAKSLKITIRSGDPQKIKYDMLQLQMKYHPEKIYMVDVSGGDYTNNYEKIAKEQFHKLHGDYADNGMLLPNDFLTALKILRYAISVGASQLNRWAVKYIPHYKDIAIPTKIRTYTEEGSHRKRWSIKINSISLFYETYERAGEFDVYSEMLPDNIVAVQIGSFNSYIPKDTSILYNVAVGSDYGLISDITSINTTEPNTLLVNDIQAVASRQVLQDKFVYLNTNNPRKINITMHVTVQSNHTPIITNITPIITTRPKSVPIQRGEVNAK